MEFKPGEIRAFRYWIQGYPNFYEPIIQQYFLSNGYEIVRRPAQVNKTDIERVRGALFDGTRQIGTAIDKQGLIQHLEKRARLQPDMLLRKDGNLYLAEFKSWGGFNASGVFDMAMLRSTFFRDLHNSAFFFVDWVAGQRINGKFLVASSRSGEHAEVLIAIREAFCTPVELFYLDEILKETQISSFIDKQMRYLDEAVYELKQAFGRKSLEGSS